MAEIAGLKLIVPSSVAATGAGSSASVSASGKVTFSTAETVSVNGCFTSTYDNYLIVIGHKSGSFPNLTIRWRASGSDASGSNYTFQRLNADNTTVAGARTTNDTSAILGYVMTTESGTHVYVYGPNLAQPTAYRSLGSNTELIDYAGTHSLSTAYDGFTLNRSSNTITGALTVYGFSQ